MVCVLVWVLLRIRFDCFNVREVVVVVRGRGAEANNHRGPNISASHHQMTQAQSRDYSSGAGSHLISSQIVSLFNQTTLIEYLQFALLLCL